MRNFRTALVQVQQQKEMLEAALNTVSIGYEGANKYKVRDPAGRPIYFVVEDSGCCSRQCCNPNHSMTLQVTDMTGERVMTMKRPWTWNCCCLCGNQPVCRMHTIILHEVISRR